MALKYVLSFEMTSVGENGEELTTQRLVCRLGGRCYGASADKEPQ